MGASGSNTRPRSAASREPPVITNQLNGGIIRQSSLPSPITHGYSPPTEPSQPTLSSISDRRKSFKNYVDQFTTPSSNQHPSDNAKSSAVIDSLDHSELITFIELAYSTHAMIYLSNDAQQEMKKIFGQGHLRADQILLSPIYQLNTNELKQIAKLLISDQDTILFDYDKSSKKWRHMRSSDHTDRPNTAKSITNHFQLNRRRRLLSSPNTSQPPSSKIPKPYQTLAGIIFIFSAMYAHIGPLM